MRNKFVYFVKPAQLALRKSVLLNVFFSIPLFFTRNRRDRVWIQQGRGEPRLLSECSSYISSHLVSCHFSKCGDVTECELILARAGIPGFSAAQVAGMTICPRHRHLLGRFWRAPKSCQYPGHTGKIATVVGRQLTSKWPKQYIFYYGRWITQVPLSLFLWRSVTFVLLVCQSQHVLASDKIEKKPCQGLQLDLSLTA